MNSVGAQPVEVVQCYEPAIPAIQAEELAAEPTLDYSYFIRKAFIAPIRTVSVVDDEYPTLDNLLLRQQMLVAQGGLDQANKERICKEQVDNLLQVVGICREPKNNWMIDVYDGEPQGGEEGQSLFAQRLHHSDLLILDYHLNGEHDGRGERALKILNQLAGVDHFNLVIVHTKGYHDSGGSIDPVLRDIISALSKKPTFKAIPPKIKDSLKPALDDWIDEDQDIMKKLLSSINDLDSLALIRDYENAHEKICLDSKYTREFRLLFERRPKHIDIKEEYLYWFIMSSKWEALAHLFDGVSDVDWGQNGTTNWIRTEKLFVTVVGKHVPANDLPDKLVQALVQWDPHPHKLLLAKLRYELDEKGIAIATDIVGNSYVQAHWLEKLLSADSDALPTEAWTVLEKHWDEIASRTKDSLSMFAQEMINCLTHTGDMEAIKVKYIERAILKDRNNVLAYANCFSSSKLVVGHHLTTGHILKMIVGMTSQYWLCLSPACDLVPGQKSLKQLGNNMPVKLVCLFDAKTACSDNPKQALSDAAAIEAALKVASRNEMLFLNIDGAVKAFCFSSLHGKANPKWEQFYAANNGIFEKGKTVTLSRIEAEGKDALTVKRVTAEVVAQLRYEYALNLLQKLGATMSRIGLDYAALHSDED